MTTFLFWNLNKRPLTNLVTAIVNEHDVDIIILAECVIPTVTLLETLNKNRPLGNGTIFNLPESHPFDRHFALYTRLPRRSIKPVSDEGRISIRKISHPLGSEILIAILHLQSKRHPSESSQSLECTRIAKIIEETEEREGHTRTLLVGDLNMNPFEPGIVGAAGLHAIIDRKIALNRQRIVQGKTYKFFYNPMWNFFGDNPPEPPGTYYYRKAEHVCYFWNIYDQIMLRPDLIQRFQENDLRILKSIGTTNLLSATGFPDSNIASDHLPIIFKLKLDYERTLP